VLPTGLVILCNCSPIYQDTVGLGLHFDGKDSRGRADEAGLQLQTYRAQQGSGREGSDVAGSLESATRHATAIVHSQKTAALKNARSRCFQWSLNQLGNNLCDP
jgi:hypothetical protein